MTVNDDPSGDIPEGPSEDPPDYRADDSGEPLVEPLPTQATDVPRDVVERQRRQDA